MSMPDAIFGILGAVIPIVQCVAVVWAAVVVIGYVKKH